MERPDDRPATWIPTVAGRICLIKALAGTSHVISSQRVRLVGARRPLLTIARISGRHAAGERSGCIDRHSVVASYSRWAVAKHLVKWVELRVSRVMT